VCGASLAHCLKFMHIEKQARMEEELNPKTCMNTELSLPGRAELPAEPFDCSRPSFLLSLRLLPL